jgi:hypothetical protein
MSSVACFAGLLNFSIFSELFCNFKLIAMFAVFQKVTDVTFCWMPPMRFEERQTIGIAALRKKPPPFGGGFEWRPVDSYER